jgi:DUF1680 family protein
LGYTGGVRITGGPFAERMADAAEVYLGMSPDDVLHGFRQAAGLPHPGRPMTGWSARTSEPTFGQWVSGLARIGVTLGSAEATQRSVELVEGWAETVRDGDVRMGVYGVEKLVCGLVDTAVLAGHGRSLDLLADVTDWASRTVDRTRHTPSPSDFAGGPPATLEWYTLAENLYRGYLAGGDTSIRDVARTWHYDAYWDRFERRPEPGTAWDVPVWLHAYSHVNTFASVAAAYEVTGEERYLSVLRNAHEYVTTTQTYATGGYGPGELTLPEDGALGRALEWRTDTAEIVCGTWAAFKLTSALLKFTGEARYGDWAEQLLYSGLGTVTPVQPGGRTPYYQDLRLGTATKLPHWDDWPCCSGTYLQSVAHLPDLVYFAADDGIAVTLFLPSTVSWEHDGRTLTLTQRTGFPAEDDSTLVVGGDGPARFTLRVRVPGWTRGMRLSVNGVESGARCVPGEWAEIDREWAPGDVVRIVLGASLRVLPVDRWHPARVALAHGPVVLAQDAEWTAPLALQTPWEMVDLDAAFTRRDGLRYRPVGAGTARQPVGHYLPLAEVPDRAPYRVYADVDAPRII